MLWDWTIWSALMCCRINGRFSLIKKKDSGILKVEELLQQPFNWVMGRSLSLISRPSQQKLRTSPPYELPFFRRNFTMSSSPLRQAPCKIETKWAPPMSHKNWTKYVMEQECMMTSSSLTMMSTCTTEWSTRWDTHSQALHLAWEWGSRCVLPMQCCCPVRPNGQYFNQFLP